MQPIRTLAFVVNDQKPGAPDLATALIAIAESRGVNVRRTALYPVEAGFLKGSDACCIIGGDGTLLGIVREAAREQVPIIGVNRGSLGFLTTFSADEIRLLFPALLEGDFKVAYRSLLACTTGKDREDVALNDVLIKDQLSSGLVRLEVFADGELVTEYYSDGLIFSTPTGSTAYNLSAGGPILHPGAEVIAMTPICPHTLSNRSIIFHEDVTVCVYNRIRSSPLLVAMDGQRTLVACESTPVEISIAKTRLPLVQRHDYSHFAVVRSKLKWSGGYAERALSAPHDI